MPAPADVSPIDVVDEADAPVGVIERGLVLLERRNFRVVHVFVFDDEGRLLLQQLGAHRNRYPLRWGSSVAGYLHAGEAEWAGARRRLREELGLRTPVRKYGATAMRDEESTKFITLYVTSSNQPRTLEAAHIQQVQYRYIEEIERAVEQQPEEFTPTFCRVFRFYRATEPLVD